MGISSEFSELKMSNIKFSVQTAVFRFYPLKLAMKKIAEAGYDGIELWGGQFHGYYVDFLKSFDLQKRELNFGIINQIKKMSKEFNLEIVCYTPEQCFYPINYLATDIMPFDERENRERSINYFKLSIDIAHALEVNKVVITTPFWLWKRMNNEYSIMSKEEILLKAKNILNELAQYAKEMNVIILLEPLTHLETTAIETLEDALWILKEIKSPNLKLMLDTGHVYITARKIGEKMEDYFTTYIKTLGKDLVHIHIDDNHGNADEHLIPGDGEINFKEILKILLKAKYKGYLSLEISPFGSYAIPPKPEELIKRSKEYISKILYT